jgi:lipoate-protein ligase A
MAYDAELFHGFREGDAPLIRFFFFNRPTLTLGRLEARRLDLPSLPFPYEIRPTGGRTVLHGEGDLCYSIVASTKDPLVGGELLESYRKVSSILAYALRGLDREARLSQERHSGLEAGHCFSSPSFAELTLNGKKVAGGAQAREGNVLLQQGVILLSLDPAWGGLLSKGPKAPMTGLNEVPGPVPLTRFELERGVVSAFEEAGVEFEKHTVATGTRP